MKRRSTVTLPRPLAVLPSSDTAFAQRRFMSVIFDRQATLQRMGQDQELFQEMIGLFQADSPKRLRELTLALKERSANAVSLAAHSLKGLAANFSAQRAVQAAASFERLAGNNQWEIMDASVGELHQSFHELLIALQPFAATSEGK